MSPQFVDFNADGHLDIVAGTYDGSPHLALGARAGFGLPQQILDAAGARIVANRFHDWERRAWDTTDRCEPAGADLPEAHLTSAWAVDWDTDGDPDLLLGDYKAGLVFVRINGGASAVPALESKNRVVRAGERPLRVPGAVATLRMIDWDGDGREDLVCGSMGERSADAAGGGGVYVFLDQGSQVRSFSEPLVIIPPSLEMASAPVRPDSALYMDLADPDGDGDMDLVVGGYSHWTPAPRAPDPDEDARAAKLKVQLDAALAEVMKINEELREFTKGLRDQARARKKEEFLAERGEELASAGRRRLALKEELESLLPVPRRRPFVWYYENLGAEACAPGADGR